jgi:predicted transcriptional regulator of viral defense system
VPFADLTERERRLVHYLNGTGSGMRDERPIGEMARDVIVQADPEEEMARAKLLVRNALRRLVCSGWVEAVKRGTYSITEAGRKRIKRAVEWP